MKKLTHSKLIHMDTDYNKIAEEYKFSKSLPWRRYIETYTFFKITGDVSTKSILDLACGEGFYSRLFKLKGAKDVIGVDISEQMIEQAIEIENSSPLDIKYVLSDVMSMNLNNQFDIVSASYLLNYSENESELQTMCDTIAKHLKPGGKFIAINNNPNCKHPEISMRKYGFERIQMGNKEGDKVIYKLYLPNESHIDIINYHLSIETYQKCLSKSGLPKIEWYNMEISQEAITEFGTDHWQDLLLSEPVTIISALKT